MPQRERENSLKKILSMFYTHQEYYMFQTRKSPYHAISHKNEKKNMKCVRQTDEILEKVGRHSMFEYPFEKQEIEWQHAKRKNNTQNTERSRKRNARRKEMSICAPTTTMTRTPGISKERHWDMRANIKREMRPVTTKQPRENAAKHGDEHILSSKSVAFYDDWEKLIWVIYAYFMLF